MHFLRDINYQDLVLLLRVPGKNSHSHPSHLSHMYIDNKCNISNLFFEAHSFTYLSPRRSLCVSLVLQIHMEKLVINYWLN